MLMLETHDGIFKSDTLELSMPRSYLGVISKGMKC